MEHFFKPTSQFFTIYRPTLSWKKRINSFSKLSNGKKKKTEKKNHMNVTVTVIRDRKIWTTPRTDQVVGIITMPAWKKISELNMINRSQVLSSESGNKVTKFSL